MSQRTRHALREEMEKKKTIAKAEERNENFATRGSDGGASLSRELLDLLDGTSVVFTLAKEEYIDTLTGSFQPSHITISHW